MTEPEKDDVLHTPGQANPSSSSSSPSSSGAAANNSRAAGGPKGPSAGGKINIDGPEGEVIQPADAANNKAAGSAESAKADSQAALVEEAEAVVAEAIPTNSEQVAQAQAEMQEWKDKFMRLHAEWDTYRRRTAEQRAEEKACASESMVERLLPVIDDFERTIDYAEKNGEKGLLSGVEAVHTKLMDALKKEGVEVLDPKGEAFHALECQAVATHEDKTLPDETVAEVFQKGYKMGRKVLRPAMVTVATGGPKREAPEE